MGARIFNPDSPTTRRRALISVTILILALSATALIVSALNLVTPGSTVQRRALMREQAVFVADAGFEHAMIRLKSDSSWRDGFANQSFGAGSYTVTLIDDGSDVVITSTGTVGEFTSQIGIRVGWN